MIAPQLLAQLPMLVVAMGRMESNDAVQDF